MLSFTLLGQAVLSMDGGRLTQFRSQKEAALLIYLAHTAKIHQRDYIAELLWESSSTKQSLTNLRTALSRLRKQVGDSLLVTRKTVGFDPASIGQVDSAYLLQELENLSELDSAAQAAQLQAALELYGGEFLADFQLSNARLFDEWLTATREIIRRKVVAAYDKLTLYFYTQNEIESGVAAVNRWLQIDILNEDAHTRLIQLYLKAGKVREAVAHYDYSSELLDLELGIALPAQVAEMVGAVRPEKRPPVAAYPRTSIRHNLPSAYDQFFGREEVQQEIQLRLDQPWCRLITIMGQGGAGKTRLATTLARNRLSQYPDGVWLVELADIDPDDDDVAEAIAVEIATVLEMRLTGSGRPIDQLIDFLKPMRMLLLLDNYELLLDSGVSVVLDIVQNCEHVQIVVTSREALKIRAEWTVLLEGLNYPTSDRDEIQSDAVELFVSRRAQQSMGELVAEDHVAIRRVCRMVEGLPLAVELAAALSRHMSPHNIAQLLDDGFDALATTVRDVPQRHRGMHIVFDMSWDTLDAELKERLARLSQFRGGFTLQAARQIADVNVVHLAGLTDKSLLRHQSSTGRYSLHPVIRTFAAERLELPAPLLAKHSQYYLTLLGKHAERLQKSQPQESMQLLEPEIENLRLAWQTGLEGQLSQLLLRALPSFSIYHQLQGLSYEAESFMHSTVKSAETWGASGTEIFVRAGLERIRFQNRLGQPRIAVQTAERVFNAAHASANRWAEAMSQVWWGEALWRLGDNALAKSKIYEALDIATELNDVVIVAWCYHQLGIIADIQSNTNAALDHFEKAAKIWRMVGNVQALSGTLNSIGLVRYSLVDYAGAQEALEEALKICDQLGDRHRQTYLVNSLSNLADELNDYTGANYYLTLGLKLATSTNNRQMQASLHINLGSNHFKSGNIELALNHNELGYTIAENNGDAFNMISALGNLASVKQNQGLDTEAQSLYIRALKIARQNSLKGLEFDLLIKMTNVWMNADVNLARQYGRKANQLAEEIDNPRLIAQLASIEEVFG